MPAALTPSSHVLATRALPYLMRPQQATWTEARLSANAEQSRLLETERTRSLSRRYHHTARNTTQARHPHLSRIPILAGQLPRRAPAQASSCSALHSAGPQQSPGQAAPFLEFSPSAPATLKQLVFLTLGGSRQALQALGWLSFSRVHGPQDPKQRSGGSLLPGVSRPGCHSQVNGRKRAPPGR